jgi:geranylgeranyl pyrophosphate synthase
LPSLLAIKSSEDTKKAILDVIARDEPSADEVRKCAQLVVKSGAIEKAKGMGEFYGMEALGHLGCLANNRHSQGLRDLVNKVLGRDS